MHRTDGQNGQNVQTALFTQPLCTRRLWSHWISVPILSTMPISSDIKGHLQGLESDGPRLQTCQASWEQAFNLWPSLPCGINTLIKVQEFQVATMAWQCHNWIANAQITLKNCNDQLEFYYSVGCRLLKKLIASTNLTTTYLYFIISRGNSGIESLERFRTK